MPYRRTYLRGSVEAVRIGWKHASDVFHRIALEFIVKKCSQSLFVLHGEGGVGLDAQPTGSKLLVHLEDLDAGQLAVLHLRLQDPVFEVDDML